jgi:hypothetical protein
VSTLLGPERATVCRPPGGGGRPGRPWGRSGVVVSVPWPCLRVGVAPGMTWSLYRSGFWLAGVPAGGSGLVGAWGCGLVVG